MTQLVTIEFRISDPEKIGFVSCGLTLDEVQRVFAENQLKNCKVIDANQPCIAAEFVDEVNPFSRAPGLASTQHLWTMRRYQLLSTIELTARCNMTAHSISGLHELFSFRRYGRNNYPNIVMPTPPPTMTTLSIAAPSSASSTLNSSASSTNSAASPMPLRFSSSANTAASTLQLLVDDVSSLRAYSPNTSGNISNNANTNNTSLAPINNLMSSSGTYAPPNVIGYGNNNNSNSNSGSATTIPFVSASSAYVPLNTSSSATSAYAPPNSGFALNNSSSSNHLHLQHAATTTSSVVNNLFVPSAISPPPPTASSSSTIATSLNHSSNSNNGNGNNNNSNGNSANNNNHYHHPKRGCTSCGAVNGVHTEFCKVKICSNCNMNHDTAQCVKCERCQNNGHKAEFCKVKICTFCRCHGHFVQNCPKKGRSFADEKIQLFKER